VQSALLISNVRIFNTTADHLSAASSVLVVGNTIKGISSGVLEAPPTAALLALSGKGSPYVGCIGVVEEGALADLRLVDGNPLTDLEVVADPAKNFVVIIKDGRICKNLLP